MHSKRALYKPAVTNKSISKEKRKPLAQGRLVTKPLQSQKESKVQEKGDVTDLPVPLPGIGNLKNISIDVREDTHAKCRRDLCALMRDTVQSYEDPAISPRRDQPQLSFHDSPRFVRPSHSLDVSDTESELNLSKRSNLVSPCEVLVVDASQTSVPTAQSSEVAVEVAFTQSPARVVCHSAGRVYSNLRHTGDVGMATQIKVERLPHVNINCPADDISDPEKSSHVYDTINPIVIKSTDNSLTQNTRPRVVQTLFKDDYYSDSRESSKINRSGSPLREATANDSDSTIHSCHSGSSFESRVSDSEIIREINKENISNVKDDSQVRSVNMPTLGTRTAKKKKPPRFVASRYMASTSFNVKGPVKATDRVASAHRTSKSFTNTKTTQPKSNKKTAAKLGFTPEVHIATGVRNSSTPTTESANLLGSDVFVDVSAIGPPTQRLGQSHMCASPSFDAFDMNHPPGSGKKKHGSSMSSSLHQSSALKKTSPDWNSSSRGSQDITASFAKKPDQHVTQLQLDRIYAGYLQWLYIEAKAKNAFKQQEQHVMIQLHSLAQENEKLRCKKEQLESQLIKIKHYNNLDETLDTQHSGLNSLTSGLAQFRRQYNTLAQGLDTTRHQIPTRGIHIPSNEGLYLADLQHALGESEQLLGELSVMSKKHLPAVGKCATSLDTMLNAIKSESEELHRCGELLAAAKSLGVHESSLQILHLQATESEHQEL